MNVLLIRHAKAIDGDGRPDALRTLTARGRKDALALGKALHHADIRVDAIVTSPLVRAVETAELVAVGLEFKPGLATAVVLGLGYPPSVVIEQVLLAHAQHDAVAVVGHEPQLGDLLGTLLHSAAPGLRKAAAVWLTWQTPDRPARFEWVLHPDRGTPSRHLSDVG